LRVVGHIITFDANVVSLIAFPDVHDIAIIGPCIPYHSTARIRFDPYNVCRRCQRLLLRHVLIDAVGRYVAILNLARKDVRLVNISHSIELSNAHVSHIGNVEVCVKGERQWQREFLTQIMH